MARIKDKNNDVLNGDTAVVNPNADGATGSTTPAAESQGDQPQAGEAGGNGTPPEEQAPALVQDGQVSLFDSEVKPFSGKIAHAKKKTIAADEILTFSAMREHVKRGEGLVRVPFEKIVVRDGFNLRQDFGDIEQLASSIAKVGLQTPLKVEVLADGKAYLVDGERRFRAIKFLHENAMGGGLDEIEAIVLNDKKTTEKDRVISMMTSNTGKELNPIEEAEGFRRLRDEHGMKELRDIAAAVGRSVPYVEQRLLLTTATPEEKDALLTKQITNTAFVELNRITRVPEERMEIMKEAIAAGGGRAKVEHIKREADNRKGRNNGAAKGAAKGGDLADQDTPAGNTRVKKATAEEITALVNEALDEHKALKGMKMSAQVQGTVDVMAKKFRAIKKLLA
jgi:ParB/RepB/Spo0J family partition protein